MVQREIGSNGQKIKDVLNPGQLVPHNSVPTCIVASCIELIRFVTCLGSSLESGIWRRDKKQEFSIVEVEVRKWSSKLMMMIIGIWWSGWKSGCYGKWMCCWLGLFGCWVCFEFYEIFVTELKSLFLNWLDDVWCLREWRVVYFSVCWQIVGGNDI